MKEPVHKSHQPIKIMFIETYLYRPNKGDKKSGLYKQLFFMHSFVCTSKRFNVKYNQMNTEK